MSRLVTPLNEGRAAEVKAFRDKLRKKGISLKLIHKALRQVLEYNRKDEEDDFFDGDHTATLGQHIYGQLIVIEEYLRGRR